MFCLSIFRFYSFSSLFRIPSVLSLSQFFFIFFFTSLLFFPKRSFVSHLKTDLIPPARRSSWSLVFRRHYMPNADQLDEFIVNSTSENRIVPFSAWRYEGFMICIDAGNISRFFRLSINAGKRSARLRYLAVRIRKLDAEIKWKTQYIFTMWILIYYVMEYLIKNETLDSSVFEMFHTFTSRKAACVLSPCYGFKN